MNQLLVLIGTGIAAAGFLMGNKKEVDTPAKIVPNNTDAKTDDELNPAPATPQTVEQDDPKPTE